MRMDIGLIYKRSGRYYLAVTNETCLTASDGKFMEMQPQKKMRAARRVSVSDLCENWDCTLEQMDEAVHQYLSPDIAAREEKAARRLKKAG